MADPFPYIDGAAVWAAARDRARATARGSTATVGELLRQFVYTRFLARVFGPSSAEQWVLKGGTAILARVRDARHTADVDLLTQHGSLERSLDDLRRACAVDLGDHFRFELATWRPATGAGTQPDVGGIVATIDAYCGVRKLETITVDLVTGSLMTAKPEQAMAGPPFPIPGLEQVRVRLYPVVDHLADKVCATEATYGPDDSPSSRVRDLVDIITLARSEDIDGPALHEAIRSERARRGLSDRVTFQIPETWRPSYRRQARRSPHCDGLEDFDDAVAFVRVFVEPGLNSEPPVRWSADEQSWTSPRP